MRGEFGGIGRMRSEGGVNGGVRGSERKSRERGGEVTAGNKKTSNAGRMGSGKDCGGIFGKGGEVKVGVGIKKGHGCFLVR